MTEVLAARVGELIDMGWSLQSQTENSAALETRGPINWLLFALSILLLFGLGALIYLAYWLATSKVRLFLAVKDGQIAESGDTWLLRRQEQNRELAIQKAQEVKERGFLKVMWPSIIALFVVVALWFVMIWLLISAAYD